MPDHQDLLNQAIRSVRDRTRRSDGWKDVWRNRAGLRFMGRGEVDRTHATLEVWPGGGFTLEEILQAARTLARSYSAGNRIGVVVEGRRDHLQLSLHV